MTGKEVKKGFAGLDSMVSDVALESSPSEPVTPSHAAETSAAATSPAAKPAQIYTGSPGAGGRSSGSGTGTYWVAGIAVVILLVWLSSSSKSNVAPAPSPQETVANPATTAGTDASLTTPTFATSQDVSPSAAQDPAAPQNEPTLPVPTPTYTDNTEAMPPVGVARILERPQIRYCLSEKIRMEAWQGQLNANPAAPVDAFNAAVEDYNSRCSNFRYRIGTLEGVQSEVEANRAVLTQQGLVRAMGAIATAPTTQSAPAIKTSFDCGKARSDAERLICSDVDLAAADVSLATLFATAKAGVADQAAFKEHARVQWNYRERSCHDRDCLVQWYANQRQWLLAIVNGQPPASEVRDVDPSSVSNSE